MAMLTRDEVKALIGAPERPAISIYMPTHRGGPETRQDPIRLKNAIAEVERRLKSMDVPSRKAKDLLEPIEALLEENDRNEEFWRRQSDGLAILRSEHVFRIYRAPRVFEELVVIGDEFHLRPLMNLVSSGIDFYVIAISEQQVRLLHGGPENVSEIELEGAPNAVSELFLVEDTAEQLQFHTLSGARPGGGIPIYHGQGGTELGETEVEHIRIFLRQIDAEVCAALRNSDAPLVFAGDVKMFSLYEQINNYPRLISAHAPGAIDHLSNEEIHAKVWPLVSAELVKSRDEKTRFVKSAVGTGNGTTKIEEVVLNAADGRVDTLLLDEEKSRWGLFNYEERTVQPARERKPGMVDLLDLAARRTLQNGGQVVFVTEKETPDRAPLACAYRY